jgi:tetratricopeptide (TPR) repeat protein
MYILEDVILSPHRKLRAIRKYLKVNQEKLAGDKIDRSLISYIENGKTRLTRSTAEVLAGNFRKIIKENGLDLQIDAEYLLADEKGQVGYQLDTCIKNLSIYLESDYDKFEAELEKAQELLDKWDIPTKKAKVYELAGDYFYEKSSFEESKIYYMKSLENYVKTNNIISMASINSKLARCALRAERYEEGINFNNYALSLLEASNLSDAEIEKRVLFNNAIAFYRIERYNKALESLSKLKREFKDLDVDKQLDILLLEGNIYGEIGEYSKAINNFEGLLRISEEEGNYELLALIYKNIGEVYDRIGKKEEAIEYGKKSIEIREEIDTKYSNNIVSTVKSIAKMYIEINKYGCAEDFIIQFLEKRKSDISPGSLIELYDILLDIYLKTKQEDLKDTILDDIFEIIKNNEMVYGIEKVILKLCNYYYDKDIDKVKKLLNLGLIVSNNNMNGGFVV